MKVLRFTREQKAVAVEILSAAFHDYPVVRYVLRTKEAEYERQLEKLVDFYCEYRFGREGTVLGVENAGAFVAIALVDEAIPRSWLAMKDELERLKTAIGHDAFARLELYERMSSSLEPKDPHYFLGMIGVRPGHQGKGYGKALLDHVKQLSIDDLQSSGVCLSTECSSNVPLYARFGYRIVGEIDIEDMHSWCMFLPTR